MSETFEIILSIQWADMHMCPDGIPRTVNKQLNLLTPGERRQVYGGIGRVRARSFTASDDAKRIGSGQLGGGEGGVSDR